MLLKWTAVAVILCSFSNIYIKSSPVPLINSLPADSSFPQSLQDANLHVKLTKQLVSDVLASVEREQKLVDGERSLPRLTRGEIEDLFEKVAREEYEKSLNAGDNVRARNMRALMLVLPFSSVNSSAAELQELYNRPPVTEVVTTDRKLLPKPQKMIVPTSKVEIISVDPNPATYKPIMQNYSQTTTTTAPSTRVGIGSTLPTTTEPTKTTKRYSSHYSAQEMDFEKFIKVNSVPSSEVAPTATARPQITPEMEEIFESLGIPRESQSKKRFKLDEPPMPEKPSKPVMSSVIKQEPLIVDDAISAADFNKGLIPSIKPDDFVSFKPIPISKETPKNLQPELKDYLKKYGLVDEGSPNRTRKSLGIPTNKFEAERQLSNFQKLFDYKKARSRMDVNVDESEKSFFNPAEHQLTDSEDLEKLEKLLDTIRRLQKLNINLTEDNLTQLDLKNFNLSSALLAQGPNPIMEDQIDQEKNEIKRQTENPEPTRFNLGLSFVNQNDTQNELLAASSEAANLTDANVADILSNLTNQNDTDGENEISNLDSTTTSETSSADTTTESSLTTTESSLTTTTTEESRNGALSDLGDSFPGGLDPIENEPKPSPRPNGFYFLLDWNQILEVGEEPDKVKVRFTPQVGDPKLFLPVTVP